MGSESTEEGPSQADEAPEGKVNHGCDRVSRKRTAIASIDGSIPTACRPCALPSTRDIDVVELGLDSISGK